MSLTANLKSTADRRQYQPSATECAERRQQIDLAKQLRLLCADSAEYLYFTARLTGNAKQDIEILTGLIDFLQRDPDPMAEFFTAAESDDDPIDPRDTYGIQ